MRRRAKLAMAMPAPFGITVRYAMKSSPYKAILQVFDSEGIHIDASSEFEAERAIAAGIEPGHISITTQELPNRLKELVDQGVIFIASSLHQLEAYGKLFPGQEASIRLNPGTGSGHNNRLSTGGVAASFGIWHEHLDQVLALCEKYQLKLVRMHTHIGTGTDPKAWAEVAHSNLNIVRKLKDVKIMNLGGGFKVGYMMGDKPTDLGEIGRAIEPELKRFAETDRRKLHIEIEPGKFLIANAGALVSRVDDVVDTGKEGFKFIKLDMGMTEFIRPSMYGAQHPIIIVSNRAEQYESYVVAGHCCETSDVLTTKYGDPETIEPRLMQRAEIGDLAVIEVMGAHTSVFACINYNSFPQAAEVMVRMDGSIDLIRRRQTMDEMLQFEKI